LKLVIVHFLDLVARFAGLAAFAGEAAFLAAVAAGFFVLFFAGVLAFFAGLFLADAAPQSVPSFCTGRTLFSHALGLAGIRGCIPRKVGVSFLDQADRITAGLKRSRKTSPSPRLSPTRLTDADSL
jgi:hypothetical protein